MVFEIRARSDLEFLSNPLSGVRMFIGAYRDLAFLLDHFESVEPQHLLERIPQSISQFLAVAEGFENLMVDNRGAIVHLILKLVEFYVRDKVPTPDASGRGNNV